MKSNIKETAEKLLALGEITIITHIRPDGDTLGCAYALYHALKSKGKRVQVVCESEISPRYRFLSDGKANIDGEVFGNVVCVDIAVPSLAGKKYEEFAKNADIVIDHHPTNTYYGKHNLVRDNAAACGEIIYDIVDEMDCIDKTIADCLYTAISTDTGCFVYASTSSYTHMVASKLADAGAEIANLNKLLFRTKTSTAFEMERRALDSLEYFYNGSIVCMLIKNDWIKELLATEDDMEGLSSIPTQIEGVKGSATFRQIGQNEYKLSVRTDGTISASDVCAIFGGGGHKMAAGCTMHGEYDNLKIEMADKLFEAKND